MEHWLSVACELPPGVSSAHPHECVSLCVLPPIWSGATMSHLCMSAFFVPVDDTHHNVCSFHETSMFSLKDATINVRAGLISILFQFHSISINLDIYIRYSSCLSQAQLKL